MLLMNFEANAVLAGFFAALASLFSKLALESNASTLNNYLCTLSSNAICDQVGPSLQWACLVMNMGVASY